MTRPRTWGLVALAAAIVVATLVRPSLVSDPDGVRPPRPGPGDVVLQIGPVDVTEGELDRYVDWARSIDPTLAPSRIRRVWLEDGILPKQAVTRILPAKQIEEAQAKAENLAFAVRQRGGTVAALRELGKIYGLEDDGRFYAPFMLATDVAFAIFHADIGGTTPAVHSAYQSVVAGVVEERIEDGVPRRRIVSVAFDYAAGGLLRSRIHDVVEDFESGPVWVHPYHREEFSLRFHELSTRPLRSLTNER